MKEWWFGLQASERRTLTIGGVALTLMLIYFAGWAPLQESVVSLQSQVQEQHALKQWMENSAAEVQRLRSGGAAGGQASSGGRSLLSLVDQTAKGAQLGNSLKRLEPEGENGVKVWLEQVAFDDMMGWLGQLEQKYAITVSTITIERQSAGRVDAHITLRGAAGQ